MVNWGKEGVTQGFHCVGHVSLLTLGNGNMGYLLKCTYLSSSWYCIIKVIKTNAHTDREWYTQNQGLLASNFSILVYQTRAVSTTKSTWPDQGGNDNQMRYCTLSFLMFSLTLNRRREKMRNLWNLRVHNKNLSEVPTADSFGRNVHRKGCFRCTLTTS